MNKHWYGKIKSKQQDIILLQNGATDDARRSVRSIGYV